MAPVNHTFFLDLSYTSTNFNESEYSATCLTKQYDCSKTAFSDFYVSNYSLVTTWQLSAALYYTMWLMDPYQKLNTT